MKDEWKSYLKYQVLYRASVIPRMKTRGMTRQEILNISQDPDIGLLNSANTCADKLSTCMTNRYFADICKNDTDVQFCKSYQEWNLPTRDCYDFLMFIKDQDEHKPIIRNLIDIQLKKAMKNHKEEEFPSHLSQKEKLYRLCCISGFQIFYANHLKKTNQKTFGQPDELWDLIKHVYQIGYEYPTIQEKFRLNFTNNIASSIEIISHGNLLTQFQIRQGYKKDPGAQNFTIRIFRVNFIAENLKEIMKNPIQVQISCSKFEMIDHVGGSYPKESKYYLQSENFPFSPFVSSESSVSFQK